MGIVRKAGRGASRLLVGAPLDALTGRRSARHPMAWIGALILLLVAPIVAGGIAAAWPAAWSLPYVLALLGVAVLIRLTGQLLGGIWRPITRGLRSMASLPGAAVTLALLALGAGLVWWLLQSGFAWLLPPAIGIYLLLALLAAGVAGRQNDRGARKREELYATIFGSSAAVWDGSTRRLRDGSYVAVAPGAAIVALEQDPGNIDARIAAYRPDLEASRLSQQQILLSKATAATKERRKLAATSDGRVLASTPLEGGVWELSLAALRAADAGPLGLWCEKHLAGAVLLSFDIDGRRAVAGALDMETRRVRDAVAAGIGVRPDEIDVRVESDTEGIQTVDIERFPSTRAREGETVATLWRRVLESSIKEAHPDWRVEVDRVGDRVRFERRPRRELPSRVDLDPLLPADVNPGSWSILPIGVTPEGTAAGQDLLAAPMALVVGPTGSGKTVALLADAAQRLTRGHDVCVLDAAKGGADFAAIEPFCRGFAREYEESVALIKAIYAEGRRRRAVLLRERVGNAADLPAAVRAAEGIRPLTLVVDEAASLLLVPAIPKGLDKEDPEVVEATALAAHKGLLKSYIGKIAREFRFVQVHIVVAMQRPDAAILDGEIRSNLAHRVQLVAPGKPIGQTELQMLFPADVVTVVYEQIARFDDGRSRGLAVFAEEGGDVTAVRVAYMPQSEIAAALDVRGVPRVADADRFDLSPTRAPTAPAFGRVIEEVVDAGVIEIGEISFDDEPEDETPSPATTAGALSFGLDFS